MTTARAPAAPLIIQTKLTPPSLGDVILRPRLHARLAEALTSQVTVVAAEAGSGKTTLLADFIRRSSLPAAWLRVDARDRDPARFLAHLLAALRQPLPSLGLAADVRLSAGGRPDEVAEALAADLVHTLAEELLLVLDDFQEAAASRDVGDAVTTLVESAPPGLRLCILSRSTPALPIARWRARGQLTTVTAADLRFTPEEIAELYSRAYGLALSAVELEHLAHKTRGWATGLVLLRNVLRELPAESRAAFLDELALTSEVYDYLAGEVLARQSPAVRRFLLATCVPDEISPRLADHLLRASDSARQLRRLEQGGLFLTCEDRQAQVYRYHPLFREFLLARLSEQRGAYSLRALHRRAAGWYRQQGTTEAAIQHWLAAEDWAAAARDIESIAEATVRLGRVHTLEAWIATLPREFRERPWLLIWQAKGCEIRGELDGALDRLTRAQAAFAQARDRHGQAIVAVWQAAMHFRRGAYSRCERLARHALAELPKRDVARRGEALNLLGASAIEQGAPERAKRVFEQALALHRAAGNAAGEASALHNLGAVAFHQGNFAEALRFDEEAVARFRALHTFQAVLPLLGLSATHHTRGDYSAALAAADEAERLATSAGFRLGVAYARCYRANALVGLGRGAETPALYTEARSAGETTGEPTLLIEPWLGEAERWHREGRPDEAMPLAALALRRARDALYPYYQVRALIELGLANADLGRPDVARRWWTKARRLAEQIGTDFLACLTDFYLASARPSGSRLQTCLASAEKRDWEFIFVKLERPRAIPLLAGALVAGIEPAARLLAAIGPEALPSLTPLTDHPEADVRRMAISALGEIGGPPAIANLRRARRDGDASVRQAATAALARLAHQAPEPLRLISLGQFQLFRGERLIDDRAWGRRAAKRLFKILIAHRGRLVPREVLIELLWPEVAPDAGGNRLKALVHHLRRVLEPDPAAAFQAGLSADAPSTFVVREGEQYGFDLRSPYRLDADEFRDEVARAERLAREGLAEEARAHWAAADALYRGDFLEEDLYEDWCALERAELQEMHQRVLEALASTSLATGDAERAAEYCRRALAADPLREAMHRLHLRALYRAGRRAEALRAHQVFRQLLRRELGVGPVAETEAVYEGILRQTL